MENQRILIILAVVFAGLLLISLLGFQLHQKNKVRHILFFPDNKSIQLVAESRNLTRHKEFFRNLQSLVEELLVGSALPDRKRIFPGQTKLIALYVVDKAVTINFSYDILKEDTKAPLDLPGILQTVVNNLLYNYKNLKEVIFYIEGEKVPLEIQTAAGESKKMYTQDFDNSLLK